MTSLPDLQPQPPRIAGWLIVLFTPAEETEAIIGDLLEEFSSVVVKSGIDFARRWYWRQTLKTIQDAIGNASPAARLSMLIAIIGGLWLIGFATRLSLHGMQAFLDAHRVYESHPNAYLSWSKFPMEMGRVLICAVVGAIAALAAKRMEMMTVSAISLVQITLFLSAVVAVIARGEEWVHWFLVMLLWNGLCSVGTVLGGLVVRMWRVAVTKRLQRLSLFG